MKAASSSTRLLTIGGVSFIHFPSDDGGRLVNIVEISNIIPNYKKGGSIVFLKREKSTAISISATGAEIVAAVAGPSDSESVVERWIKSIRSKGVA